MDGMCHYLYVGTRDDAMDTRLSCVTTCTWAHVTMQRVVMCHYLYVGTRDGARDTRFSCVTTCTRARDDANFANKLAQSTTEC